MARQAPQVPPREPLRARTLSPHQLHQPAPLAAAAERAPLEGRAAHVAAVERRVPDPARARVAPQAEPHFPVAKAHKPADRAAAPTKAASLDKVAAETAAVLSAFKCPMRERPLQPTSARGVSRSEQARVAAQVAAQAQDRSQALHQSPRNQARNQTPTRQSPPDCSAMSRLLDPTRPRHSASSLSNLSK